MSDFIPGHVQEIVNLRAEIERLRHEWAVVCKDYGEARAEIERLRATLLTIRHDCRGINCDGCKNAVDLTDRALEGKG